MIQVIHRALDIIEFVASCGRKDIPLKEIANHLGLNHGTCSNILKTLVDRDYLVKSSEWGKGYSLGPMIQFIGGRDSYTLDLVNAAKKPMADLTESINESCMIGILRGNIRVSLLEVYAERELRVILHKEKLAFQTASGRILLAHLNKTKLKDYINKYGLPDKGIWEGVQSFENLEAELDKIKKQGYTIQVAKSKILGIAIPIYTGKSVVAAMGVFLPDFRFNKKTETNILTNMQKTAKTIECNLLKLE